MKLGYADPPYPGCADLYRDHPDYAGEVDHAALVHQLQTEFDGWVLHTSATPVIDAAALALLQQHYGCNDQAAIACTHENPLRFAKWRNKAMVALVGAMQARAALNHGEG